MRVPSRMIGWRALACSLALCTFAAVSAPVPAWAGPARGLCQMNTSRGRVPAKFPIQACVDGSNIWLYNTTTLVLQVVTEGDIGKPVTTPTDLSLAADATRLIYNGEWVMLPGDKLQIPIGSGAAAVNVGLSSSAQSFYALANAVATFFPLGDVADAVDMLAQFVSQINADFNDYKNCKVNRNFLGQAGCFARFSAKVVDAVAGLGLTVATAHTLLGVLLSAKTFLQWSDVQIPQFSTFLDPPLIVQAALGSQQSLPPGDSSWIATEAPPPANIDTGDPSTDVYSISCPSTTECTAVGVYDDDSGNKEMLALTLSGGVWTPAGVPLPANAAFDPEVEVPGLSCPSVNECVAVGSYQDSSGGMDGLLLTWSGGAWSSVSVPLPANAATSPDVSIYAVSCASVNDCVAGGSYTDSSGNTQGLLLIWSGGSWAPAEAPVPSDAGSNPWAQVQGVSCPTTTRCVAVGSYGSQVAEGLLWTWSAGSWTVANLPALPGGASDSDSDVYDVSCPSVSQCVAVGYYNDNQDGLLLTLSGGSWTAVEAPVPGGGTTPHVGTVSCASVNYCVAAGIYGDSSGHGQGLLLTWSDGSWTPAEAPTPANAASDPTEQVQGISCPAVNGCLGGGVYENSNNTETGLLLTDTG
jgi:hypothetical protein